MAHRSKEVQNFAVICSRITDTIGREHRQLQRMSDADRCLIAPLLFALVVALHLDVDIFAAEDSHQPLDGFAACLFSAIRERRSQWAFIATGETDQPGCILLQIIPCGRALGFFTSRILKCVISRQRF